MEVTLRNATKEDLPALRTLAEGYYNDLRPYYPDGCVRPCCTPEMWMDMAATKVHVILADGAVAGFAVTMFEPCLPGVAGNYLAEFCVRPKFRHSAVALKAGRLVVGTRKGEWTADVLHANERGERFADLMTARVGRHATQRLIETPSGPAWRFRFEVRD